MVAHQTKIRISKHGHFIKRGETIPNDKNSNDQNASQTRLPQKDGSGCMFQTLRHSNFEFVSANLKNGRYSDFEFKVFTNTLETAEPFQFSPAESVDYI